MKEGLLEWEDTFEGKQRTVVLRGHQGTCFRWGDGSAL